MLGERPPHALVARCIRQSFFLLGDLELRMIGPMLGESSRTFQLGSWRDRMMMVPYLRQESAMRLINASSKQKTSIHSCTCAAGTPGKITLSGEAHHQRPGATCKSI